MPAPKLFNSYTVENGVGYIHIVNRKGEEFEILVDVDVVDMLVSNDISLSVSSSGYASFKIKGMSTPQLLHRLIMNVSKREEHVDHINACKLDCRRENMRVTDAKGNANNPNNKPT